MRKIGNIEEQEQAQRFIDYLFSEGIAAHFDAESDGATSIWVEDEDALESARSALSAFREDPEASVYHQAAEKAETLRKEERRKAAAFSRQVYDRNRIERRSRWFSIPVTRVLIILSVMATLLGGLGTDTGVTQWLSITAYEFVDGGLLFHRGLPEILRGQVWRLFTPIFLHASLLNGGFGILHILFNMLWLMDLGGMVERVQGGRSLLIKVLLIGGLSNLLQYAIGGPAFGGMSGVVFGLLGYCWIRGRLDLTSGLFVHQRIMFMMTFWFVLGFTGMMGPIANAAHAGGLVAGLFWGYLASYFANMRRS